MTTRAFDFPNDLSPFPRKTRDIIRMAHELGWSMRWQGSNKNILTLISPLDHRKTVNVPRTNLNEARERSTVGIIARHSDPDKVADFAENHAVVKGSGSLRLALDLGPDPKKHLPVRETAVERAMREAAAAKESQAVKDDLPPHGDDDPVYEVEVAQFRDGDPSVHLVSETPWMVRKDGISGGTGRMYESPVVLHRVWSDGGEDYRCRHCPYTSENPRSVSAHAAKSANHPKTGRPTPRHVENYEATDIKRPMSAIRRLTSDLLHALDGLDDWSSMSPDELAKVLAEHVYEERPDREPVKPLTPEQVIARITLLVDGGRLADLHQQVDRLAAALVESTDARNRLADEVIAEQQKVEALREERRTLAALLADEGGAS